ncbi:hypothetical protein ELK54_10035 [Klebsiella pneumoniae]|nr:hypothetical protein [Klebsiella pneumoniae]MBL2648805.1 hypothetical protein [Klebsiella pneumoniae]
MPIISTIDPASASHKAWRDWLFIHHPTMILNLRIIRLNDSFFIMMKRYCWRKADVNPLWYRRWRLGTA